MGAAWIIAETCSDTARYKGLGDINKYADKERQLLMSIN